MYVGHTHSTRRQMYIVCVCVSSTLRVPFRYPSGSLLRSKLDPLASMGWLWVAWALLAVAPAPIEPEARYGFPSGNISTIPDFPVTLDGLSRVVFRLDETSSSNCAPRVEGFHFSPPPAAATAAPTAHGLRDVVRGRLGTWFPLRICMQLHRLHTAKARHRLRQALNRNRTGASRSRRGAMARKNLSTPET